MNSPRAIVAEFHKSKGKRLTLFALTVIKREPKYIWRDTYDVDHSRQYGYIFHMSGCGGCAAVPVDGIYFTSGDVAVEENPSTLCNRNLRKINKTRRLHRLPKAFQIDQGKDLLDWLQCNGIQETSVWCSKCDDYMPGDELCEHCWWCDEIGWYSTPSEPCKCRKRGPEYEQHRG